MEAADRFQKELSAQTLLNSQQQKQLEAFIGFSTRLSQSLELTQVLQTGVHMVMEMMRVQFVLLFALDEKAGELRIVAYEGIPQEFADSIDRIKMGEGFAGRVAQTGEPLVIEDISRDPRLSRPTAKEAQLKASVVIALKARGKIVGTLSVGTRTQRHFEQSEVDLLAAMGNQIGIAMENSRLYQEQIDIVGQLKESEERYRQLFENAHDAIWVQDLTGKNIAANDAAAKLIGYQLGHEIVGKDVREFIPRDSLVIAREIREKLVHGDQVEQPYEQRLIKKDGSEVILKLSTSLLTTDGRPAAFQHIARDITNERRLQENLRFYVQQITQAQEEESKRIARELHDSSAQSLIATIHHLEGFCRDNPDVSAVDSRFLWNLREQLKNTLQEIRQFSRDLRPSILDDLGLLPAVEWLAEGLKREHKIESTLTVSGTERRFSPETEVALFRITQEALRNIVKHARATRADVRIEFRNTETVVTVTDDGQGFEPPGALGDLPRSGKLGLVGMQERARLIGAALAIQSAPGHGTTLTVTLPIEGV